MGQINVYAAPLPFSNRRTKHNFPVGSSIQEIVEGVCPYDLKDVGAIALVDGDVIAREQWPEFFPDEKAIVNVRVIPQKGGGGKNPLATILSIAVMIAAPYIAGALLGPGIISGTLAGATLITRAVTAAVGIVGKLLVSALAPPPKPSNTGSKSNDNQSSSPTMFIEGASNSLDRYGVIPCNLGTNRMVPKQAALPYTETQNNDQYVRQIFTWGWGEEMEVEDIRLGDTAITQYTDYEMVHRLNGDLHESTNLYSNDVFQDEYSVLLQSVDSPTVRTTRSNIDEAIVDFTFVQGLFGYNSAGSRVSKTVHVRVRYAPTGTGVWTQTNADQIDVTASQAEALRISARIKFPTNGTYDIELDRTTEDNTSDQIFDKVYLTAIKNITHTAPIVLEGLNGTALRMKATEQLNGVVDQLNGLASTLVPDFDLGGSPSWVRRKTSNPASLYRYVLQGAPNARPLPDNRIAIEDLEAWHTHCVEQGYSYNRVIDYEASVDDVLRDIAAAGAASPAIVDGKRTIVIDKIKEDIVQVITPRNSWGYSGEIIYPQLPHALRVQFRNSENGYLMDERIVYDDGFDESNATEFEVLELVSCTDADLAFKAGRRYMATARLRPENHQWNQDVENIVYLRGDRVKFEHDVPIIGVGDGRIKTVETDGDSPEMVTGFTIDDTVTIPDASNYYTRIRLADGSQLYKQLITLVGDTSSFEFAVPFAVEDAPEIGDLCYFVEAGGEKDLIITRIDPGDDLTARVTAQDYAPEIFTAESAAIPAFNSAITPPLSFQRPIAPVLLGDPQSDNNAMLKNSDGTWIQRAIFMLQNNNDGDVITSVKVRLTGSNVFGPANVLESTPERLILTGLQDNTYYDVHIRYQRPGASTKSLPLQINNFLFVGSSGPPHDVEDFEITVAGNAALMKWTKNTDIDLNYYTMKYSSVFSGATWETAQILEEKIYQNNLQVTFQGGTYLIKAIDQQGFESVNATAIITYDPGFAENNYFIIDETDQSPIFPGVKDNVEVFNDLLILIDESQVGYYYFSEDLDAQGIFTSEVISAIQGGGVQLDEYALNDIFDMADFFAVEDLFGLTAGSWRLTLEYRWTTDDPAGSPVVYNDWREFIAGSKEFWNMQFRLKFESYEPNISPAVILAIIKARMPDRIERGENLTVDATLGATVVFTPPFKQTPATAITIQNGAADDKIEYLSKNAGGFSFKVYNATLAGYVTRTYDHVTSGFGRDNT